MALLKSIRAVSPLKQKERKTHEPARVQSHPRALEQFVKKKLYIYIFLSLHEKKRTLLTHKKSFLVVHHAEENKNNRNLINETTGAVRAANVNKIVLI